jgi:3-isopropylmalate dehydrogenase
LRNVRDLPRPAPRWTDLVFREARRPVNGTFAVGVLRGEGVGPEVIGAALTVLSALEGDGRRFAVATGGPIGRDAEVLSGRPLTEEVAAFCAETFAAGGAVLSGPGGGRFVYDLRQRFDLFCKLSPLRPIEPLLDAGCLNPARAAGADVLVVRENAGGEYFGSWRDDAPQGGSRVCEHVFRYSEPEVRRLVATAARLAAARRGRLAVIVKDGGFPSVSALWRDLSGEAAARESVDLRVLDIDLAAYLLVRDPLSFDVIAASNLFGDVLADVGALLLGARGASFSGNFSEAGAAVYQTNHGSALDIAGQGRANPIGQICSLAMLLRESLGLAREASWIEESIAEVVAGGHRPFDVAGEGERTVGTAEMGERVAEAVRRRARSAE